MDIILYALPAEGKRNDCMPPNWIVMFGRSAASIPVGQQPLQRDTREGRRRNFPTYCVTYNPRVMPYAVFVLSVAFKIV